MQVTYFNDTDTFKLIKVDNSETHKRVEPQTMATVDIKIPKGYNIFIKQWTNNTVFISTMKKESKK